MMIKFLSSVFLLLCVGMYAQNTSYTLIKTGYKNQNGNYLSLGGEIYWVSPKHHILSFSLAGNVGNMNDKWLVIPEAEVQYMFTGKNGVPHSENFHSAFYGIGLRGNHYYIEPKLSIILLSLVETSVGYSIALANNDYTSFEGVTFGLHFHVPTQIFGK